MFGLWLGGRHRLLIVSPPQFSALAEWEGLGKAERPAVGEGQRLQASLQDSDKLINSPSRGLWEDRAALSPSIGGGGGLRIWSLVTSMSSYQCTLQTVASPGPALFLWL